MRRKIGTEIKAGIFVVIGLLIVISMILFIGGSSLLEKNFTVNVVVPDAVGVVKGAVVKSGGLKIGRASEISFSDDYASVKISMLIEERFRQRIRADSVVRFQTQGMLGDKYLEIIGGTQNSEIIANNATLEAEASKDLSSVLSDSQGVIQLLKDNLLNLKQISNSFVQNRQSEKFFKDMGEAAGNIKDLTGQLKSGSGMKDFGQTMNNFKSISEKMKNGEGTIGALLNDPSLYEDMKSLIGGANRSKVLKFFVRQAVKTSDESAKEEQTKANNQK
jgi:phospholipid/cholesterol/gamma-HCH transport system substrate-binding protein